MAAKTRTVRFVTDNGSFELAVNPKQISVTCENGDKTIELLNVGTVTLPGHRGPVKISISCFLPSSDSPFYKGSSPESIIQMIESAKNGQKTVRIIVSGTSINNKFIVSSAGKTYTEGQKDVTISWSFTEDRFSSLSSVASMSKRYTDTGLCQREDTQSVPKTVTVKKNDTLWDLAVKTYGDGSRSADIASKNGIKDPDNITIGMKLEMPE